MDRLTCSACYVTLSYTVLWCQKPKGHLGEHADDKGNTWSQGDNGMEV